MEAFDEQLVTLETSLRPPLQWLKTWSVLECAVIDFWPPGPTPLLADSRGDVSGTAVTTTSTFVVAPLFIRPPAGA